MLRWTRGLVSGLVGLALSTTALGQPVEFRAGDNLYRKCKDWWVAEGVAHPTEKQISALIEHVMNNPENSGKISEHGNRIEVGSIIEFPSNGAAVGPWTNTVYTSEEHPALIDDVSVYYGGRYRIASVVESSIVDVGWAVEAGSPVQAESILLVDELHKRDRSGLMFKEEGLIQTDRPFNFKSKPWGSDAAPGPAYMQAGPMGAVWFSLTPMQGAYMMPSAFMPMFGR
jgi:hypothetical protein